VITISTEEDLSKNVVTRVYDIRDLIINVPDFTDAPDFNIQQQRRRRRPVAAAAAAAVTSSAAVAGRRNQQDQGPTRTELVDSIVKLIQDTVASESWKDNGGNVGSIRELSGQLIVTQTPENQRQLVRLLEQLRETRAIQVTVETRFLFVQRNFLEDIGLDFDFVFNNVAGNIRRRADHRSRRTRPTSRSPGQPRYDPAGQPRPPRFAGSASRPPSPSSTTSGQRAAPRHPGEQVNSTITAPRVTLFNGQRAYVLVATSRAYVSDLNPVVGSNAVGFDPSSAPCSPACCSTCRRRSAPTASTSRSPCGRSSATCSSSCRSASAARRSFPADNARDPAVQRPGHHPAARNADHRGPHHRQRPRRRHAAARRPDDRRRDRARGRRADPLEDPVHQAAVHQPLDGQGRPGPADPGQADDHHPA
jgi:hypothetical protein